MNPKRKLRKMIKNKDKGDTPKSFLEHLLELRQKILFYLVALLIGSMIGYFLSGQVVEILIKPLNQPLYYSSPSGGLEIVVKTSLLFGFLVSIPVFLYQIFNFFEPAIGNVSSKWILLFFTLSCILAAVGIGIGYFLILPATLNFLINFGYDQVKPLISASDYFSFIMIYLVVFALLFQIPLIMFLLNKIISLKPRELLRFLKFIIPGSFIFAAIVTPTLDIVNQTILALPIILLYILSIGLIWFANKYLTKNSA
jgi:sec-independent protein translocase protein TatC